MIFYWPVFPHPALQYLRRAAPSRYLLKLASGADINIVSHLGLRWSIEMLSYTSLAHRSRKFKISIGITEI